MKKAILAGPALAVIQRLSPTKKKLGLGSLFALRLLPGWTIAMFLAAFAWSAWSKSSQAKQADVDADY